MTSRRTFALAGCAWAATGCGSKDRAASAAVLEAAARREGMVRIDAATGLLGIEELMKDFAERYPGIKLDFHRQSSLEQHQTFLGEVGAKVPTADIIVSPAMDLQFKLVNDGFAATHVSAHKPFLPDWAVWKDQAYAVCSDPLVFAYNKRLVPPQDVPQSHEELVALLRRKPEAYLGKITTYNPETSGTGYLYYTQDLLISRDTLDLVQAVGRTRPVFYIYGAEARNRVGTGQHLLAYNMVYSYMILVAARFPDIGIVFPRDYTLVVSRMAFVPRTGLHPAAGKLFLDFMLSETGQTHVMQQRMMPVRLGMSGGPASPPPDIVRRIHFGPALMANLDEFRRRRVLHEWRRALES